MSRMAGMRRSSPPSCSSYQRSANYWRHHGRGRMRHGTVLLDVEGPLARVTLNRPEVLNAANLAFMEDFEAVVDALEAAREVKLVLVRGNGRAFSAGLDLDMSAGGKSPALLGFFERQERSRGRLEALDTIT